MDLDYTLYVNHQSGTVQNLEELVSVFHAKFFNVEGKLTLAELERVWRSLNKDLDTHVKTFRERILGYCNPAFVESVFGASLHKMLGEEPSAFREFQFHLFRSAN